MGSKNANERGGLAHRKEILGRLARSGKFWAVANPAGPVAEVRIYDEIWWLGVNADDFARDLESITAPEILVAINSPGGDVFDAIAIYNALRNHSATITTRVDGIAASAASVIVQAGDKRTMMSGSQMMIHEPWGITVGPASEMRAFADLLDRQTDVLAGIYAGRSGKQASYFHDIMVEGNDVWMTAEETVAEGLADQVADPAPKTSASSQAEPKGSRLNDEVEAVVGAIASTLDSVERVAALRAEKGKKLSNVNAESLDGLRAQMQRLESVLTEDDEKPQASPTPASVVADMERTLALLDL